MWTTGTRWRISWLRSESAASPYSLQRSRLTGRIIGSTSSTLRVQLELLNTSYSKVKKWNCSFVVLLQDTLISRWRWSGHCASSTGLLLCSMPPPASRSDTFCFWAATDPICTFCLFCHCMNLDLTRFCSNANRLRLWQCGDKRRSTTSLVCVSWTRWINQQQSQFHSHTHIVTFILFSNLMLICVCFSALVTPLTA